MADAPVRVHEHDRAAEHGRPGAPRLVPDRGLAARGYETTLLAGQLARGEDSMAFVAQDLAFPCATFHSSIERSHRSTTRSRSAASCRRSGGSGHRSCTRIRRRPEPSAARRRLLAGAARPPIIVHTFHGHVLRGYFDPLRTEIFRRTEHVLARHTNRLIAVEPGGARRSRRAGRRTGVQVLRDPARHRPAGARRERRRTNARSGGCSASRRRPSSSAGSDG